MKSIPKKIETGVEKQVPDKTGEHLGLTMLSLVNSGCFTIGIHNYQNTGVSVDLATEPDSVLQSTTGLRRGWKSPSKKDSVCIVLFPDIFFLKRGKTWRGNINIHIVSWGTKRTAQNSWNKYRHNRHHGPVPTIYSTSLRRKTAWRRKPDIMSFYKECMVLVYYFSLVAQCDTESKTIEHIAQWSGFQFLLFLPSKLRSQKLPVVPSTFPIHTLMRVVFLWCFLMKTTDQNSDELV